MSTNLTTPAGRVVFSSLFEARGMRGDPNSRKQFSVQMAFPPDADMSELKKAAEERARLKWGKDIPKGLKNPIRLNSQLDKPIEGLGGDWLVMTFRSESRPGVVDEDTASLDESGVYSGMWGRVLVQVHAFDYPGSRGISFPLQHFQKLGDAEPLGFGRVPVAKAFSRVPKKNDGKNKDDDEGAAGIFD
jgi:hypothetical protein